MHITTRVPAASFVLFALLVPLLAGCSGVPGPKIDENTTATQVFRQGLALEEQGELKAARKYFEAVVEHYPSSSEAREAEWLAAEMSYRRGELKAARKAYQDFHKTHRLDRLGDLEGRIFDIGRKLYEEGRSGLLGLGILPTSEEGIITLTWLTKNLRNGSLEDDALFYMAKARFEERNYPETVIFLDELLTRCPRSEWGLEARFLKGRALLLQNRGPAYDRGALREARETFREYVRLVERDKARRTEYEEHLSKAKGYLARIGRALAEKDLLIARFYLSVERPEAARGYLASAAREEPDTEAGREAGRLLKGLESSE